MKKKLSWPSLLMLAALLAIAVSPVAALAGRGDRPTDLPGDPPKLPEEYEFGDPEPTGGGAPQAIWMDLDEWKQILLISLRIRFGVPAIDPMFTTTLGRVRTSSVSRGTTK